MIENKNEVSRNLEKALQALEQAKQRVVNEKKNLNIEALTIVICGWRCRTKGENL